MTTQAQEYRLAAMEILTERLNDEDLAHRTFYGAVGAYYRAAQQYPNLNHATKETSAHFATVHYLESMGMALHRFDMVRVVNLVRPYITEVMA